MNLRVPGFLALFILPAFALCAADPELPHVTAFGTAVTEAKPDLLRWYINVYDDGADLTAISDQHAQHTAAVLKLLQEKHIRPDETQTSGMRFGESREYRNNSWIKVGYEARTYITFTMRNLADYSETWLALARLGYVSMNSVEWDLSNRPEVQDATRNDALKAAKKKAGQMAAALNSRAAEPIAIEELGDETPWQSNAFYANTITSGARPGPNSEEVLAPGSVTVRVRVKVVFHLIAP